MNINNASGRTIFKDNPPQSFRIEEVHGVLLFLQLFVVVFVDFRDVDRFPTIAEVKVEFALVKGPVQFVAMAMRLGKFLRY